jgi:hypothetical protein
MEFSREQVERFLDSVEGVLDLPDDPQLLATVIQLNAQRAQSEAKRVFGIVLTPDDAGVKILDQLLTEMHNAVCPNLLERLIGVGIPNEHANRIALSLGAFYGEILRVQSGGQWKLATWRGEQVVALALTAKATATPLNKVAKHFLKGASDSILQFHSFSQLMARAAKRGNSMPPEERAELRAKAGTKLNALLKRRRNEQ